MVSLMDRYADRNWEQQIDELEAMRKRTTIGCAHRI